MDVLRRYVNWIDYRASIEMIVIYVMVRIFKDENVVYLN
jgi:hypothetical protein